MKRTIAAGVAIVAIAAPASASAANGGHGIKTQGILARVSVPGLDQKLKLVHKQIPRCVLAREVKARASGLTRLPP